jgi:peptide/nickel transport system permease protein
VLEALVNTIVLITVAYFLTVLAGVVLGVFAGRRAGTLADSAIVTSSLALWSMPTFWLGLVLVFVFSVWLGGLPVAGMVTYDAGYSGLDHVLDVGWHLILPTVTLVVGSIAQYALIMRNSLVGVLDEDYVTTARAKGLRPRRVLWNHAVPNALLPTFTLSWLNIGIFLSTTLQVEVVFSWPGLGLLIFQSVNQRDYPVLEVAFLAIAAVVIVANLLNDLLYPLLDPRIVRR